MQRDPRHGPRNRVDGLDPSGLAALEAHAPLGRQPDADASGYTVGHETAEVDDEARAQAPGWQCGGGGEERGAIAADDPPAGEQDGQRLPPAQGVGHVDVGAGDTDRQEQ